MTQWKRRRRILTLSLIVLVVIAAVILQPQILLALLALAFVAVLGTVLYELTKGRLKEWLNGLASRPERPRRQTEIDFVGSCTARGLGARRSSKAEEVASSNEPPYARFAGVDDEMDKTLTDLSTQAVLVHGNAGLGKTRMLYEAIVRNFSDSHLVRPDPNQPGCIEDLIEHSSWFRGDGEPVIVWLDNVDNYIDSRALTLDRVRRASQSEPRFLFVATIRSGPLDQLASRANDTQPTIDFGLLERLLDENDNQLRAVELLEDTELDPSDENSKVYAELDLSRGLGLALSQRDVYQDAYRATDLNPLVRALVSGTVDLRRVGLSGPFARKLLVRASSLYDVAGAARSPTDIGEAFTCANSPLGGSNDLRLLTSAKSGGLTVDDLLLDIDSGLGDSTGRPICGGVWTLAIESATTPELIRVALSARAHDRPSDAEKALCHVQCGDDRIRAAHATFVLGLLYKERGGEGDEERAIEEFELAVETDDDIAAPAAMLGLAALYEERGGEGDEELAIRWYERAVETDHEDAAPTAVLRHTL